MSPPNGWLRPGRDADAVPRWGHVDGLSLGLAPLPGPRGLLRLYAPWLGHESDRVLNFVAIEPTPRRRLGRPRAGRGFSELELSRLDDASGLRLWTGTRDDPYPETPDPGRVETRDGVEHLSVTVHCERFGNGAEVSVRVRFAADRPHEVQLAATASDDSAPLARCVLSATMANFARLRTLRLTDGELDAARLWPRHHGSRFTRRAHVDLDQLPRDAEGRVVATAVADEADPTAATYHDDVAPHWRWYGTPAAQSWLVGDPHPRLRVAVNGRSTYWASRAPIPGGVAFENIEVVEPYRPGRPLTWRVG